MNRNPNTLWSEFIKSKAIFNDASINEKGEIIVNSLQAREDCDILKSDTTLHSMDYINVNNIEVKGNLICRGDMNAKDVIVRRNLICGGDLNVGGTIVFGDLVCCGNINSKGHKIIVYGNLLYYGNCNAEILVSGKTIYQDRCIERCKKIG